MRLKNAAHEEKVCTQQYVTDREAWQRWNVNMKPKQTFVLCLQKVYLIHVLRVTSGGHAHILGSIKEEEFCFKRTSAYDAGMSYLLLSKL